MLANLGPDPACRFVAIQVPEGCASESERVSDLPAPQGDPAIEGFGHARLRAHGAFPAIGLDKTKVSRFADPDATVNRHGIRAGGIFGTLDC